MIHIVDLYHTQKWEYSKKFGKSLFVLGNGIFRRITKMTRFWIYN
jgi:hypothetical protein